jgi:hypothetical protein
VHTVSLPEFVVSQMTKSQRLHSQETFNSLMNRVDSEVLTQLKQFVQ